jgi:hypothetical protein
MWEGCDFFAWWRLLCRNYFAVHPRYIYIAVIITFVSAFHTILRCVQDFLYRDVLARTRIEKGPLFIIGHWRTGTTLLHELLILDERHTYPNTYQCLEPNHFLLTERFFRRWVRFLVPSHRPMDNMAAGWERPQEDEFALCMLGQPSPYLTVAFPNHSPQGMEYLDLDRLPDRARKRWKQAFVGFLRRLAINDPRRLILKSPTHSCRIKTLLEIFPDACFVHIVRNPYVVFPSTMNLWKSLYRAHGLQCPTFAGLGEHVLTTFVSLYERLEEGRPHIAPRRFYELRYEDLVNDPVAAVGKLYDHLELGGFERLRPRLERYLEQMSSYKTNRYELPAGQRDKISRRWGPILRRYGYAVQEQPSATPMSIATDDTDRHRKSSE